MVSIKDLSLSHLGHSLPDVVGVIMLGEVVPQCLVFGHPFRVWGEPAVLLLQ